MKSSVASILVPPHRVKSLLELLVRLHGLPDNPIPFASRSTCYCSAIWHSAHKVYTLEIERDLKSEARKHFLTITPILYAKA